MSYKLLMIHLATSAIRAHGPLQEVVFLEKNNHSLLVFADGTVLPTNFAEQGDPRWSAIVNEAKTYAYLGKIARQAEGKNPLSLLTFGDDSSDSLNFAAFLRSAGFKQTSLGRINLPLRLRADGMRIHGTKQDGLIIWEDGSATPEVGIGQAKNTKMPAVAAEVDSVLSALPAKSPKMTPPPISTQAKKKTAQHPVGARRSKLFNKLTLGCGGFSGLLTLCAFCAFLIVLFGSSNPNPSAAQVTTPEPSTVVVETATALPEPPLTLIPTPTPMPTSTPIPTPATPTATQIFDLVSPSVAFIETSVKTGSGVLISDGYVVTNAHVVWPFQKVRVVFPDGTEYRDAPVLNWDLLTDLAIIGPVQTANPPLALVNGEDLVIGNDVFLIGYPGEKEQFPKPTITRGLISRLREWDTVGITYFQTDATIAGGQSGGALVSGNGEVIGISGFSFTEAGFGLVASAADIRLRVQQLIAGKDVAGLGDRRLPLAGGQREHNLKLNNFWDQRVYLINEPVGTHVDLQIESEENEAHIGLVDMFAQNLLDIEDKVSGVETRSATTEVAGPYFVILGQYSEYPGNLQLSSNQQLVPYDDMDDGSTVTIGQTISGDVDYPWDVDYFVIDLVAGDTVEITVDSILIDPVVGVDFLGATDEEIIVDDNSGGGLFGANAKLTYQAPHSGSYFIVVEDRSARNFGGYLLTVE
ncbi:MAG: trypsin-like peptidase domain-containing protein [Anaerolineales bacterium]|nr:trypsin-like peptidase domain-containing protein [Anaerolineales bacterium]